MKRVMIWRQECLLKDNLLDEINADATGIGFQTILSNIRKCTYLPGDLVSVFRKLERSGDHITNIAKEEIVASFIDAKVLKHRGKGGWKFPGKVIFADF